MSGFIHLIQRKTTEKVGHYANYIVQASEVGIKLCKGRFVSVVERTRKYASNDFLLHLFLFLPGEADYTRKDTLLS